VVGREQRVRDRRTSPATAPAKGRKHRKLSQAKPHISSRRGRRERIKEKDPLELDGDSMKGGQGSRRETLDELAQGDISLGRDKSFTRARGKGTFEADPREEAKGGVSEEVLACCRPGKGWRRQLTCRKVRDDPRDKTSNENRKDFSEGNPSP